MSKESNVFTYICKLKNVVLTSFLLGNAHDLPHTDDVIGVANIEHLAIRRPEKRDRSRLLASGDFDTEFLVELSALKVVDLDARGGSGSDPETARGEGEAEDLIGASERVRVRRRVDVPDEDLAVLAGGGAKRTIRSKNSGVDVALVTNEVGIKFTGVDTPGLKYELVCCFFPQRGHEFWWIRDLGGKKFLTVTLGSSK